MKKIFILCFGLITASLHGQNGGLLPVDVIRADTQKGLILWVGPDSVLQYVSPDSIVNGLPVDLTNYHEEWDDVTDSYVELSGMDWLPDPAEVSAAEIKSRVRLFVQGIKIAYDDPYGFDIDHANNRVLFWNSDKSGYRSLPNVYVEILIEPDRGSLSDYHEEWDDVTDSYVELSGADQLPDPAEVSAAEIKRRVSLYVQGLKITYDDPYGFDINHATNRVLFWNSDKSGYRTLPNVYVEIFIKPY